MKRRAKATPPGKAETPKAETLKLSGQGGEGKQERTSPPAPLPIGRGEGGSVRGGEGMRRAKATPPGKAEIPKAETLKLSGQGGEGRAGALPTGHLFLTKPQMAGVLQVSVRTVTSMMANGELPFLRFQGRLIRFRLEDVQRQFTEKALVCNGAKAKENA